MSVASRIYVARRCTEVGSDESESKPLCAYAERSAYVLLGAPGAGKTEAFKHEAERTGAKYVKARNFLTFAYRPGWHGRTLYIDGLDKQRAGSSDRRTALDAIRAKLDALDSPSFRLSCREADWFGAPDRAALAEVSPDGAIVELRLSPLADSDVGELLGHFGVADVEGFLAQCRALGIEGMVGNPQTLEMLAKSVAAGGQWPTSRSEVFERSCRKLARELNEQHQQANVPGISDGELLSAAGRLSAVWLLTGTRGYVEGGRVEGDRIALSTFSTPTQRVLLATVRTALFDASEGALAPLHRHVAEFLGGRYLADRVANGLPTRRALALLKGYDGGIVSELRGLAAWFAAHSPGARRAVVELDPLGVVLYGDVRGFSAAEKRTLIDALERIAVEEPSSLTSYHEMDARWGDLATADMRPLFSAALSRRDATEAQEALLIALLDSLARGSRVPGMASLLLDTVRDGERALGIRELSLDAYLNQADNSEAALALAGDIRTGSVSDPQDNLLAALLRYLYPRSISPDVLASYLVSPKDLGGGRLAEFWEGHVPHASTLKQLGQVMDALADNDTLAVISKRGERAHYLLRQVPWRYLWTLLEGGRVDARRMFGWLARIDLRSHSEHAAYTRKWFAENPETFKELYRISVAEEADPGTHGSVGWWLVVRVGPPSDFGIWCVDQIDFASSERMASHYLRMAAAHIGDNPDWDGIAQRLNRQPARAEKLRELWEAHKANLAPASPDLAEQQMRQTWHHGVLEQSQALDENRANAELLDDLASVYFGLVGSDVTGDDPSARLLDLLLGDEALVERVIRAFVMVRERQDLPTEKEIMRTGAEGRRHYLSLPFLAGLEERSWEPDEGLLRTGLSVLVNEVELDEDPAWYTTAVATRHELLAEVLAKSARHVFRTSAGGLATLYRLREPDYGLVAEAVIVPVLRSFPTRAAGKWLPLLATLLCVGLVRRRGEMPALIRAKSGAKSMDLGQRMYWLCAGLITGECEFIEAVRSALRAGGERRVRHFASFFDSYGQDSPPVPLKPEVLELLIRSVGGSFGPVQRQPGRVYAVTPHMASGNLVRGWIDQLAGDASATATDVLRDLVETPALSTWRRSLRHAATAQLEARRNATFEHPDIRSVLETLDCGRPANAADLAALTVDVLEERAQAIRHSPTSDWKQYWKTGVDLPAHEDDCRDRLVSDLNLGPLLRFGVRAEPEGRYADAKRADIKVLGADAAVPVEIKKSTHRELWTAMRSQLMAKYATDTQAEGYGIYLVLWFGEAHCQPDSEGRRAHSADDLRARLLATLDEVESRKISVCMIDVSP